MFDSQHRLVKCGSSQFVVSIALFTFVVECLRLYSTVSAKGVPLKLDEYFQGTKDMMYCLSLQDNVTFSFCNMDRQPARETIAVEALKARSACTFRQVVKTEHSTAPACEDDNSIYALWFPHEPVNNEACNHLSSSLDVHSNVTYSFMNCISPEVLSKLNPQNLEIMTRGADAVHPAPMPDTELRHCDTDAKNDPVGAWSFDRFGPFHGEGGYSWHTAAWENAGQFRDKLLDGSVYVTAFGFYPTQSNGEVLGMPPIHIHHMHVTHAQTFPWTCPMGQERPVTFSGLVPFDIHGDRQCQPRLGATDCLIREFPVGFGIHVSSPFRTFYDLNDARAANSDPLVFYTEHAYKWSHAAHREVGRFGRVLSSNVPLHDDYLLYFAPGVEYLVWAERDFQMTATFVHMFWHTHHDFTTEMLAFSAHATQLGLTTHPFNASRFTNLATSGFTRQDATDNLLQHLLNARNEHIRSGRSGTPPLLRCTFEHGAAWEKLPTGGYVERYHAPPCNQRWAVKIGDPYTLVSFHSARFADKPEMVWLHTVLYGLYVQTEGVEKIVNVPVRKMHGGSSIVKEDAAGDFARGWQGR